MGQNAPMATDVQGMSGSAGSGDAPHAAGEGRCLNCGAALVGEYCHECGQAAHVHRTLSAWWHELLHGVLHLDGKVLHTLPLLAWRPGELTRRYIEGERARFVSPLALFLFSVFLMFAIFSALGGPLPTAEQAPPQDRAEARQEIEAERAELVARRDRLLEERSSLAAAGRPQAAIDAELRGIEQGIAGQDRLLAVLGEPAANGNGEAAEPASEPELVLLAGWDSLNEWAEQSLRKAQENPSLLVYKIQANAYKFSWALVPISVPFVWVLFLHRRKYRRHYTLYDHTVFVTYSISFMTLALVVITLLRAIGLGAAPAIAAMTLVPPIHMYRQLRGAYRLPRFSALWRTFLLLIFAFVASSFFFTLLLMLGLLG